MVARRRIHGSSVGEDVGGDSHECDFEGQAVALGVEKILLHHTDVVLGIDQSVPDDAQR